MSTIRNPVGPQPPSVYWRRRLVLLLGLIAVIVVIVLIVVRPGAGAPDAKPSGSPSTPVQPSTNPSPTFTSAAGGEECNPAQVKVTAVLDDSSYSGDEKPQLSMKIENQGTAPCTFDVGTGAQEYEITSGNDRIWNSTDCQEDPTSVPKVLPPGEELSTEPFEWDRHRSAEGTCKGSRPEAVANSDGPTYRLEVKLGDATSEKVAFRLF